MYGFCVHAHFRASLGLRELWRDIGSWGDFIRIKGGVLFQKEIGVGELGFLQPLIPGERLEERSALTVLDAPTLDLLPQVPEPPPHKYWGGALNVDVRLNAGALGRYFREWHGGEPLRILLLQVFGTGVSFWTESHVYLADSPLNPIREHADENLLELVSRVDALARRFPDHLEEVTANFHELKGPFRGETERLKKAFSLVPHFNPAGG